MSSNNVLKGVIHVHTELSHDGVMDLEGLKSFFRGRGFNFVCLTDHSQDVSFVQYAELRKQAAQLSESDFVFVPGLEYSCNHEIHIMGVGLDGITDQTAHGPVIDHIHANRGMAILAHPGKISEGLEDSWIRKLDGAEIWNQRADGRFLPQVKTIRLFRYLKNINPGLLAFFGADFHGSGKYQRLELAVPDCACEPTAIVEALKAGRYSCSSGLLTLGPEPVIAPGKLCMIGIAKGALNWIKALRNKVKSE